MQTLALLLVPLVAAGAARALPVSTTSSPGDSFQLHLLHLNDWHARYDETDGAGDPCDRRTSQSQTRQPCYGGFARIAGRVRQLLAQHPDNYLLLNAGDNFQGTLWYTLFTWNVTAHFLNKLPWDAATLGNHEFDDGVGGVLPFLEHIQFPVVLANMDASQEPSMVGKFNRSVVVERGGRRIGVVGYVMQDLPDKATTGNLTFTDEAQTVAEEAARLKQSGVDIIVALSHAGLYIDRDMATKMRDVDIIVGGHTHSLLYTGKPPTGDAAEGPYPTIVTQDDGHKVAVVQAGSFGKYLGHLVATFDANGELLSATGNPELLDEHVPQDETILEELIPWRNVVEETGSRVLGRTNVLLNASNFVCRGYECNIGNFLTDAMVDEHVVIGQQGRWTRAAVALMNGGNIRTSIDELRNGGDVTYSDLLTACPFRDGIDTVTILGSTLREVLEASVEKSQIYTVEQGGVNLTVHYAGGNFLQQSGLRVVYDVRQPVGNRVNSVLVRCAECRVPRYEPLVPDAWYTVAITTYMAQNRDTFRMLRDSGVNRTAGRLDTDVFIDYMKKNNPITHGIDGRTVVLY
ncbi:apyrase-like [Schistocerca gregaria]|uniref:apyrase-like n=1 Tax=Schistocerca gregaria TaxID=7010 RepID=UPI00211ED431|nr:apyrase-like [Schistocerca gregaria]